MSTSRWFDYSEPSIGFKLISGATEGQLQQLTQEIGAQVAGILREVVGFLQRLTHTNFTKQLQ